MKRKLLILCGLLAFWACSGDKNVDGVSAERPFGAVLHGEDVEEDSNVSDSEELDDDFDPEELDEDADPEELDEDIDLDEDSIDDPDELDEPSSSSKKKNTVRSSSSADKSPESSEYSVVNIEPVSSSSNLSGSAWSSSSSSSRSARSSSTSYKNCCTDIPSIADNPTYTDLWYGFFYTVDTDVYAGKKWKNRDVGLWFTNSDSSDGGESRIIWPERPGTEYDAASLDPIIDYCNGLCGEFRLDGGRLSYDPFVEIGFIMVGQDSNGMDIAVDVSNWEGICIQYTADIAFKLLLDLGDSVNKTMEYDVPMVNIPKSYAGANRCFLWRDFQRAGWGRGTHITGEEAAKQLVKIRFKLQSKDGTAGYFSIISLGTVKGNRK
jgi:AAA ATPase containing von Willebrand factor type A (vWA) domain